MNIRKFLFEDEAVIGIDSPNDYFYVKVLQFTLTFINSWPLKEMGMPEPKGMAMFLRFFHLFLCLGRIFGGVMFIVLHYHSLSFFEMGHNYITFLMDIVIVSRVSTLTFVNEYRVVAKEFLTKFHLFFYKHNSDYAMKTHKRVHMISHLFTIYLFVLMIAGLSLYNLTPMYNNLSAGKYKRGGLKNDTFEQALYYSYPFNVSSNVPGYIFACIFHWFVAYVCVTWFCMLDLFLSLMVFNIWGHFNVLMNKLDNFPRPNLKTKLVLEDSNETVIDEIYSDKEQESIFIKLTECINHHRDIVNFTNKMSNVFGPMLFVYYSYHQLSGCLLLLECSQMTAKALIRYLPLTLTSFQQLIQLSVIFELIGSTSDRLKHSVYGLPWECMDTRNRKLVAFFLMNVQEPIHVKAMGMANVGVTSMATILKTSSSYFAFLRTM